MSDADGLPPYSENDPGHDEMLDEGIGMDDDDTAVGPYHGPLNYYHNSERPSWSFANTGPTGLTNSPVADAGDNDSIGANSNGSNEDRIQALGAEDLEFGTPEQRTIEVDDHLVGWNVESPEPPVMEIKVTEDEVTAEPTGTNMKQDEAREQ